MSKKPTYEELKKKVKALEKKVSESQHSEEAFRANQAILHATIESLPFDFFAIDENGYYFFRTVKPGAYPWRNWVNNWRPAHIHLSVFGSAFAQRLITQLYFEGDPLISSCPIVNAIPDPDAINQLIACLDMNASVPLDAIAYKFDIVLRGRRSTLFENRLEGN